MEERNLFLNQTMDYVQYFGGAAKGAQNSNEVKIQEISPKRKKKIEKIKNPVDKVFIDSEDNISEI